MTIDAQVLPTSYGVVTASTQGTTVTGGSSAGAYGSVVVLAAATDYDAAGFFLNLYQPSSAIGMQIKLFVGGSGSEVEFCELPGPCAPNAHFHLYVPIAIPAGSRVTAKLADADGYGSATAMLSLTLVRGDCSQAHLASRGRLHGVTSGVLLNVDAGATANTKGAWTQIVASTTNAARGYSLRFAGDASCDANTRLLFDLAVGAASSEQIILADITASEEGYRIVVAPPVLGPVWTPIPAGSRIAIRVACSVNTAANRVPQVALVLWE